MNGPILVMISYEIDVGFAIGRLISAFHAMAMRLAGSAQDVHFSFGKVGDKRSPHLPAAFSNLLEFDYRNHTGTQDARLADYIAHHRIRTIFGLDVRVNAPWLRIARRAGVQRCGELLGRVDEFDRSLEAAAEALGGCAHAGKARPVHLRIARDAKMRDTWSRH